MWLNFYNINSIRILKYAGLLKENVGAGVKMSEF